MSDPMTAPDPKTVREIARTAAERAARRRDYIGSVISDHPVMAEILADGDRTAYGTLHAAVVAEQNVAVVTVSWPDEQQPADVVTAERQQDGAVGPDLTYRVTQAYRAARFMRLDDDALIQGIVAAVLAERTALAARVAELAGERDEARAQLRTETAITKALLADKEELAMRAHHAEVNRDQARAALESARVPAEQAAGDGEAEREAVEARPGHGPGVPGAMHLEAFGQAIADAFGDCPYHVGSSATSKTWRDVDVRLILNDEKFHALFPGFANSHHIDAWWSLLCAALSELGRARTGLPIDFQIQSMTEANEKHNGIRNPLFLIRARDEHAPTILPTADLAARDGREASAPGRVRTEQDGASE